MRAAHLILTAPLALTTLALAPAALAAPRLDVTLSGGEPQYGVKVTASGRLHDGAKPLAGKHVVLETRRYPYHGDFRRTATATTGADGRFRLSWTPLRNADLQVEAPEEFTGSGISRIYVWPRHHLAFAPAGHGRVRLTQTYAVPAGVTLRKPTVFYLGSGKASRASVRRSVATTRTRARHYRASVTVKVPSAWHGHFRYGACFQATPGTGMGDPHLRCPARLRF